MSNIAETIGLVVFFVAILSVPALIVVGCISEVSHWRTEEPYRQPQKQ